ncbi:hypothetical protein OR60_00915 [Xanthomonas vesicatoria]|uniref:Uncharacterized protein n=1 Tax=Xanthomonas vesicatoria TaxID=56460 RepID=A0AAJ0IXT8_9XANT|nr:hypothetical protein OR61_12275 [Xanthomonas vesicatoria]KHM98131.1 hypothetical protein OR60_00915 [Xanthomonas vesicatoria]KLB02560.1 hypothetical protein SM19410_00930 [Xanthomonas hortorum pv. gardneri]KLB24727.1 hypothetical protein SM41311_05130 [Xanthomonas hortorum pv. gardneri]KLB26212.1 hypothetical protein SM40611_04060 [Xanthomonas hortorum pv. gardneri]
MASASSKSHSTPGTSAYPSTSAARHLLRPSTTSKRPAVTAGRRRTGNSMPLTRIVGNHLNR